MGVKSGIRFVVSQNFTRIKGDSYDSLPLEKILVLIKSVLNKD